MYRIILCCANGASTDMLAVKMEKAAVEQGIELSINAYPYTKLEHVIDGADLVLIAPQIRYKLKTFESEYSSKGIPFMAVEPVDYGMLDGAKVLSDSIALINSNKDK